MGALNFKGIRSAQKGPDRDDFELFARELLAAEKFRILEDPDRGTDGGRDMIVAEDRTGPGGTNVIRWLVSCKHKAHTGRSVFPKEEDRIWDRLKTHRCDGFLAFYSTLPSSGLKTSFKALDPEYEYLQFDPAVMERKLLATAAGRQVAARYMPASYSKWRGPEATADHEIEILRTVDEGVAVAGADIADHRIESPTPHLASRRLALAKAVNHRQR